MIFLSTYEGMFQVFASSPKLSFKGKNNSLEIRGVKIQICFNVKSPYRCNLTKPFAAEGLKHTIHFYSILNTCFSLNWKN